jgi:hypothetical protein
LERDLERVTSPGVLKLDIFDVREVTVVNLERVTSPGVLKLVSQR